MCVKVDVEVDSEIDAKVDAGGCEECNDDGKQSFGSLI